MANRCLLHILKLDDFKKWLTNQGIRYRPEKGDYQVLQVLTPEYGWQVIFRKVDMPEHYVIQDKLESLVRRFINEQSIKRK